MTTLTEVLASNQNDLTDQDLAVLADWANGNIPLVKGDWKRAYALLREGADLLLRRRARSINGKGENLCPTK